MKASGNGLTDPLAHQPRVQRQVREVQRRVPDLVKLRQHGKAVGGKDVAPAGHLPGPRQQVVGV